MKIGENVLPEHAGRVRREVPYFDLTGDESADGGRGRTVSARDLSRLAASAPNLLVIDGAQGLTTADGRGLAELIPDLVEAGTAVVLRSEERRVGKQRGSQRGTGQKGK